VAGPDDQFQHRANTAQPRSAPRSVSATIPSDLLCQAAAAGNRILILILIVIVIVIVIVITA
jgi:hypothetical protein